MEEQKATIIHFVRHGTVHNPKNTYYGRLPGFGISWEGMRLARSLEKVLSPMPIQRIISSPLLRAKQTARVIAGFYEGIQVSTSKYLNESFTPFDGRPIHELEARNWDIYTGIQKPFEQPRDIFQRGLKFIYKYRKIYQGQQIIAVTHADVIVFLSLWAAGYDTEYKIKQLIEKKEINLPFPAPASITSFSWKDGSIHPELSYYQPG